LMALETEAASAERLAEAFRAMHSFKGNCGICGLSELERLTHRAETLVGKIQEDPKAATPAVTGLLLEVIDAARQTLGRVLSGDFSVPNYARLAARLDEVASPSKTKALSTATERRALFASSAPNAESSHPEAQGGHNPEGADGKAGAARKPEENKKADTSIRVDTEKLDDLMNLVGELIIAETTVTKNPDLEGHDFENFQKAALNLNRITRSLQEIAMAVRMVPISATFRKMVRLVRDVSNKQHKKVELLLSGEETEVDKTVVESISDPLVHLIRNAVDHGIESSEDRVGKGKPAAGHVWLDARHQSGEVWITLRDDGRGLDPKKILAKALQKKIADPRREYTDREVIDFIFAAGFSTADAVTDISGRGVGMDVVRRNIEAVGGKIETNTRVGSGTTFTLRIPLTLAIIEGMLVRVGSSYYTIPLLAIRESVKAKRADVTLTADGAELMSLRKRFLPVVRVYQFHGIEGASERIEDGILMVVESSGKTACLLVDEVIGQRQTVIKSLPDYLRQVRGVAGCSILPNGDISLILDIEGVLGNVQAHAA
jgi:two-component system, chemotaxis family, sensor kinase CheA